LKRLAIAAQGPRSPAPRQCLERLPPMAGFQLSIYGRFWVSTEAVSAHHHQAIRPWSSTPTTSPLASARYVCVPHANTSPHPRTLPQSSNHRLRIAALLPTISNHVSA